MIMMLIVKPLVVRVFSLVHRVVIPIRNLLALLELPAMSYFKMTVVAKYDAVAERVSATVFYWFTMMRLPSPACAFGAVFPNELLAASTTGSTLPVPSIFIVLGKKVILAHPIVSSLMVG